jgi:hypothetical protein
MNKRVFSKKKLIKDFLNFDWKNYIDNYSDLSYIETKEDAWYHWINYGKHENRKINNYNNNEEFKENKENKEFKDLKEFKEFDWKSYISSYDDLKNIKTKEEAWKHWINHGKNENRIINNENLEDLKEFKIFDWKYYISLYDDLKDIKTKEEAWKHWITHGKNENRIISNIENLQEFKEFDWKSYISLYDDLKDIKTKEEAWKHWINYGKNENRLCENIFLFDDFNTFDWNKYINNYEDLQYITTKEEAWRHFIEFGFNESRKINDLNEYQLNEYKKILEDENIYQESDFSVNKIYFKKKYTNCGKHLFGWKSCMNYLVEKIKLNDKSFNKKYYFDEWIEKLLVWGNKLFNKKCLDIINDNQLQLITFLHCPPFKSYDVDLYSNNLILNDDSLLNENIIELINTNNLFYSIKYLYVLSISHKNYIINNFPKFKNKVVSLYHPININNYNKSDLFDINSFVNNKEIYHIGWWLRNFTSFFNFKIPDGYKKITLVKQEFQEEFDNKFGDIDTNNKIIYELNDEDYIKIFNKSCIFCDLVDCVANNVVLECIKYNTPIIIKRLPSVEEYLGTDYPLFFNDESELEIYKDEESFIKKINKAHNYLKKMDKKFLNLETFLNKINYDIDKLVINNNKYKLTWLYYLNKEETDIEKYISVFNYQLSIENIKLIIINSLKTKISVLEKYNNYNDNITIINVDDKLDIHEIYKIFVNNSTTEYLVFKKFNNILNEEYFSDLCINYFDNNSTFDIIIFKSNNENVDSEMNNILNNDLQIHDDNSESSNDSSTISNESNINEMYQLNDNEIEINEDMESEIDINESENVKRNNNNDEHLLNSLQVQNYNFIDDNINILWRKSIHSYLTNFDNNFWINCHKNHLNIFEISYKN